MTQNEKGQEKVIGISVLTYEAAKLFSCLSLELQDELLSVMRELVAKNKAAQAATLTSDVSRVSCGHNI